MSQLHEKALLVSLNISQWTGRKLDKAATTTVETSYSTQVGVGNYHKRLLPGASELKAIESCASSLRGFYRDNSLPWCADGSRIIAAHYYSEFLAEYRLRKAAFDRAVADFLDVYPLLQAQAAMALGSLYRPAEYPSVGELSHRFNCELSVMPIPAVSDFRVDLSEAEKAEFVAKMESVERKAMRECWDRLHATVAKAAATLAAPGAIFRDSLVSNITEMCAMLPKLNVSDDPALEAMRVEVERIASGLSPDTLRNETAARSEAVKTLDAISDRMAAYMGGK